PASVQREVPVTNGERPECLSRMLETGNPRCDVCLDSAVVGEELPPALPPRGRVPSGSDVVLPAPTAAALPLIGPEVQVLVPVDSMDPETAADPHGPTSV